MKRIFATAALCVALTAGSASAGFVTSPSAQAAWKSKVAGSVTYGEAIAGGAAIVFGTIIVWNFGKMACRIVTSRNCGA